MLGGALGDVSMAVKYSINNRECCTALLFFETDLFPF